MANARPDPAAAPPDGGPTFEHAIEQVEQIIERIYALSGMLNDKGQYLFYGRVAGCLITGNEDGIKHCAQNVLYSLQHVGYTIPPNADVESHASALR